MKMDLTTWNNILQIHKVEFRFKIEYQGQNGGGNQRRQYEEQDIPYAPTRQFQQARPVRRAPQYQQVYQSPIQYVDQEEIIVQYEDDQYGDYGQPVEFIPVAGIPAGFDNRQRVRPRPQAAVRIPTPMRGGAGYVYQNSPQYNRVVGTPVAARMQHSPRYQQPLRPQSIKRTPGRFNNQSFDDGYDNNGEYKENEGFPAIEAPKKAPKLIKNPTPKTIKKTIEKAAEVTPIVEEVDDEPAQNKEPVKVAVKPRKRVEVQEEGLSLRKRLGMTQRPLAVPASVTESRPTLVAKPLVVKDNVSKMDSPVLEELPLESIQSEIPTVESAPISEETPVVTKKVSKPKATKKAAKALLDTSSSDIPPVAVPPKSILKKTDSLETNVDLPVKNIADLAAQVKMDKAQQSSLPFQDTASVASNPGDDDQQFGYPGPQEDDYGMDHDDSFPPNEIEPESVPQMYSSNNEQLENTTFTNTDINEAKTSSSESVIVTRPKVTM